MFRKLLNPDSSKSNSLTVFKSESGCCGSKTNLARCQYSTAAITWATVVANGGMESITIDDEGTSTVLTFSSPVTDVTMLKDAIIEAAKAAGYLLDNDPRDVFITGTASVTVDLYGELKATSMTDGTATYNFTEKCTKEVIADYTASYSSFSASDIVIAEDGATSTLSGPFAISAAGATALETALKADVASEQDITATYNAVDGEIDVVISHGNAKEFILDGKTMSEGNIRQIFV